MHIIFLSLNVKTYRILEVSLLHANNLVEEARASVEVERREGSDALLVDAVRALVPVDLEENSLPFKLLSHRSKLKKKKKHKDEINR